MPSVAPVAGRAVARNADRKDEINRIQQEIRLSQKQYGSLPSILMSAPYAINFLGQLRLISFSENALRVTLTEPRSGFKHLNYPSLQASMQQIVHDTSEAFSSANKNMHAIDLKATLLFGRESLMTDVLSCLRDEQLARTRLRPAIQELRSGMQECSIKARGIESAFNKVLAAANELNLAMGHQMKIQNDEEYKANDELRRSEIEEEIQQNIRTSLEKELARTEDDLEYWTKQYRKSAKGGKWSDLGFKTVNDVEGGLAGIINGAVGVLQEAPTLLTAAVNTAGVLGGAAVKVAATGQLPIPSDDASLQAQKSTELNDDAVLEGQAPDLGIDPALAGASEIHDQLLILKELVNGDLLKMLQEEEPDQELLECDERLKACKEKLYDFRSRHCENAKTMLDSAQRTIDSILESRNLATSIDPDNSEWQKKVQQWKKEVEAAYRKGVKLNAFASSKASQGFGDTFHVAAKSSLNRPSTDFSSILKSQHQKLLIKRESMREARQNLQKTNDRYLQTQNRAIQLASKMRQLQLSKTSLKDIRQLLGEAIDTVTSFQRQIRQLTQFFEIMANTISIVGETCTERYITAIESGFSGEGVTFGVSYGEVQTHMIRKALLLLRGHFSYMIDSARLYQRISADYILPAMDKTADLQLTASPEEQTRAKEEIKAFTDECAEAIKVLAQKELRVIGEQIDVRVEELDEEVSAMGLPAPEPRVMNAIKEGVKESSQQSIAVATHEADKLDDFFEQDL